MIRFLPPKTGAALGATIWAATALPQQSEPAAGGLVEEVVVTGSYLGRPSQQDSLAPLSIIDRQELTGLNANEISDVIERLTINMGSQNNPDAFTQNLSTGTTNVNLRGLGVGATLVLVNDRRQTPSAITTDRGESFVDTSSLPPLIALERIEVQKDGATALYGSDAVGGVVNVITRDRFQGLDLQAELLAATEHSLADRQISGVFGTGDRHTHLLAAFNVLQRGGASTGERRLSGPADDLSQSGNPGSYLLPGRPDDPVYGPLWTSAFDRDANGIADALEPDPAVEPR